MEKRKCLECNETFNGRADKKFCSDLCRNAHNNKLNSDQVNYVRNINNILRKNRRIIEDLLPEETSTVSQQKLVDKGFNFNYYTNITTTKSLFTGKTKSRELIFNNNRDFINRPVHWRQ